MLVEPLGEATLSRWFWRNKRQARGLEGGALPGARRPRGSGDGHWKEDTVCLI